MACEHEGAAALTVCPQCRMVVPQRQPLVRGAAARKRPGTAKQAKAPSPTVAAIDWQPITVRVEGVPVTQGSMRAIGKGRIIHEKEKELKAWRGLIATALTAAGAQPVGTHTPIRLDVVFWLPRPASVTPKKRPLPSAKSADLDKAIRAVGDALSGVIIEDDSQITSVVAQKRYATEEQPPGAWIRVTLDALPAEEPR